MRRCEPIPGIPFLTGEVGVTRIIKVSAIVCDTTPHTMLNGNQRDKPACLARKLAAYIAARHTPFSFEELARMFNRGKQGCTVRTYNYAFGGLLINEKTCFEASRKLSEAGALLRNRQPSNPARASL